MEERDLLESAYVQAPTKPGNYIRLSEFCSKLAEIASKSKNDCKYCTDDDHIKERLEKLYENIKFNPEYKIAILEKHIWHSGLILMNYAV